MSDGSLDDPTLGQAFGTLSGSKCQQIKLASERITSKAEIEVQPESHSSALSSQPPVFFGFPISHGDRSTSPYASVPTLAYWRLSALTRYLPLDEDKQVIASPNLTTSLGRRNQAILLLLAR
jgi:hypothetical protein